MRLNSALVVLKLKSISIHIAFGLKAVRTLIYAAVMPAMSLWIHEAVQGLGGMTEETVEVPNRGTDGTGNPNMKSWK